MTDYSQQGEQGVLEMILGNMDTGYAVDVGAADGEIINNTLAFEEKGWKVLCIEPNPFYFEKLSRTRKLALPVACDLENRDFAPFTILESYSPYESCKWLAGSALDPKWDLMSLVGVPGLTSKRVVPVAVRTLEWCLEWAAFPRLDFLSIDTEGNDFRVLQSMDLERWKPKVIVLENWVDDPALKSYLESEGYHRHQRIHFNDLYVRQDARVRESTSDAVPAQR